MEHAYKFHSILISCWPTLDLSGFAPEIRINSQKLARTKTLKFAETFQTKEQAEDYALDAAKKWIDESHQELPEL